MSKGYISGLLVGSLLGINLVQSAIIFMGVKGFVRLRALDPEIYKVRKRYRQYRPYGYRPYRPSTYNTFNDYSNMNEEIKENRQKQLIRFRELCNCDDCVHKDKDGKDEPCNNCYFSLEKGHGVNWERRLSDDEVDEVDIQNCTNCKYKTARSFEPEFHMCQNCYSGSNWAAETK